MKTKSIEDMKVHNDSLNIAVKLYKYYTSRKSFKRL